MDIEIVLLPDERLHTECDRVEAIDDEIREIAQVMAQAMYDNQGCGIAAPQIGVLKQIVVIDCEWGEDGERNPLFLINPEIVEMSEERALGYEGCLSVPGISVEVERACAVTVQAYDLEGQLIQYEAEDDLFCVCLQHEIDHLHGKTMVDRLGPIERLRAIRDYQRALAAGAKPGDTE